MARIDLLTAQMCRRAARRLSVQSDEKMQFFGGDGELQGESAALSGPMIHEFLLQVAPVPFDGVPVSFTYKGCEGEFKISVAARCRGFEIHALSFTAPPQLLPNPAISPPIEGTITAFDEGWSLSNNSYRASTKPSHSLSPGVYRRREAKPGEDFQGNTD